MNYGHHLLGEVESNPFENSLVSSTISHSLDLTRTWQLSVKKISIRFILTKMRVENFTKLEKGGTILDR